jgi:propanol-preferring alcohol dehydrogenase
MLRRRGTMSLVGLPPGTFDLDIFDLVLSRKTIRGSIVGTRLDLAESLRFAAEGKVKRTTPRQARKRQCDLRAAQAGKIDGRVVMEINPSL